MRHLPNLLTASRLLAALAFPFLPRAWWLGAALFACATEYLDGALARRFAWQSDLGRLLDPVADRTFGLTVSGTLVFHGILSLPELGFVVAREFILLAGSLVLLLGGRVDLIRAGRPTMLGKVATVLQLLFLTGVVYLGKVPAWLLLPTGALSLAAGAHYAWRTWTER